MKKNLYNQGIFVYISTHVLASHSFSRGRKGSQIDHDFDSLVKLGKDRLTNLDMTDDFSTNVRVFTVHKVPKHLSSNIVEEVHDSHTKVKEYQYRCELIEKSLKSLYSDIKKNILDIVNRKRKAAIERISGTKADVKNALMRTESSGINKDSSGEGTILEDEYFGSYDCKVLMFKDIVDWFNRVQEYHSADNKGDSNKKRHLEHHITYRKFCVILNLQEVNIILTKNKLYYIIPDYVSDNATSLSRMSTKASRAAVWSAAGTNKVSLKDYVEKPNEFKNSFIYYVLSVLGSRDNVEVWKSDNKFEFSNKTASSFCLRIYTIYFYLFLHGIKHRIDELNHPKKGRYTILTIKMDGGNQDKTATGNSCMLSLNFAKELTYVKRELGNIKADIAKLAKLLKDVKSDDDNLRCLSLDGYNVAFFEGLERDKAMTSDGLELNNETPKLSNPFKSIDFDGTEMLIKHYILDFEAQDNEVDYMMNELQFNEKSLELRLETSRNELTLINTYFTITSAFFGFGGFIAGIFGMNLDNSTTSEPGLVQSKKGSFIVVSVISAACIVVGITTTYYYLRYKNIIPEKLNISKAEMTSR